MARRNEARRAQMRQLLAEQKSSGLSAARFARDRGMSPWTLYKWRRRLREEEVGARGRFVEVKVVGDSRPEAKIALELPSGVRVHVPHGFEEDDLRRVLAALESC